ncbi:MAG: radical SAM protein [Candidatus Aureabacteria bacterium]|nr:radical SAM protein [Candidatus Auribacterota bacterium]
MGSDPPFERVSTERGTFYTIHMKQPTHHEELPASYHRLHENGELARRAASALRILSRCALCPRGCGVNRLKNETGECRIGLRAVVSSVGPHFGEEPPLVGMHGSGTIFFSGCNLHCVFCQNFEISQSALGETVSPERLASLMLAMQNYGCHNLNLVSPTHVAAQILEALMLAVEGGLRLPIVYNSGGYDSPEILKLLDGVVDIYMPDAKYGSDAEGETYSHASGYWDWNRTALREMHRQVGVLEIDRRGIARRGLLIRHLVLPNNLARSENMLRFIAEELSPDSYVNIMDQYRPCHRADSFSELGRVVRPDEFARVLAHARSLGLHRGF